MIQITSIIATPAQTFQTALADGSIIRFSLTFRPRIPAFFLDITWGTFALYGLKLANTVNLLDQFRNLPFGLMVFLEDGTELYLIDDFTTGRAGFYILEQADLDYLASVIGGLG